MKFNDIYEQCLFCIKSGRWKKAEEIIVSFPSILICKDSATCDTILITALKYFCPDDFLKFLIESGCDVNAKGRSKNTPLYHACVYHSHSGYFYPMKSLRCRMLFRAGARMTPFEELKLAGEFFPVMK